MTILEMTHVQFLDERGEILDEQLLALRSDWECDELIARGDDHFVVVDVMHGHVAEVPTGRMMCIGRQVESVVHEGSMNAQAFVSYVTLARCQSDVQSIDQPST